MKGIIQKTMMALLAVTLVTMALPKVFGEKAGIIVSQVKAETVPQNPRIVTGTGGESEQVITWDCIWFGSYPQTEIVDKPETCGTSQTVFGKESDYIVDEDLYSRLANATDWDEAGTITIDGQRYRKMTPRESGVDTLFSHYNFEPFASWIRDYCFFSWDEVHYFRYEKIKWRVLNVTDGKALLLSDRALDSKPYNDGNYRDRATWKSCSIRSWLNGYDDSQNQLHNDYSKIGFLPNAFSADEKNAIFTELLDNDMVMGNGYTAGEKTADQVFFLAVSDVFETEKAQSYGFAITVLPDDEARGYLESSTFAKAMGKETFPPDTDYVIDGWWLRTAYADDKNQGCAKSVDDWTGNETGRNNDVKQMGVRPSLYIDLGRTGLWDYAGTVQASRKGTDQTKTQNETDYPKTGKISKTPDKTFVNTVILSGISRKIAAGKKIKLVATVLPKNATNPKVKWTTSNKKIATVTQTGLVKIGKKTGGKSVKIIATATDGSNKKAVWKIKVMKGAVTKVTIKGAKKTLKIGKTMKLKAFVRKTKGTANKKLKWSSSNPKYATVTQTGKVKAMKAGKGKTVRIIAMATDGSNKKSVKRIKIK